MRTSLHMRAMILAAASLGFAGAQRLDSRALDPKEVRPLSFDPLALLRRPPRAKPLRRSTWGLPHCGAKQARSYARQAVTHDINQHYEARMRWNETVYPRVLASRANQQEGR